MAAREDYVQLVTFLVENGADIDKKDQSGVSIWEYTTEGMFDFFISEYPRRNPMFICFLCKQNKITDFGINWYDQSFDCYSTLPGSQSIYII